ncbi:unnamed protein product [Hymenolepis diminuta]|nr:unnamed protein product [Hymenolepis diminuta]
MNEGFTLKKFCGNLSTHFWDGQNVGFCMAEISMHSPVSIIIGIISTIYVLKLTPSLAFEWPFTRMILLRIILDFILLSKCASYLVVSMIPLINPPGEFSFSYVANYCSTLLCILCVTFLDIFHGKVNCLNSRGSNLMLVLEILYFYIASMEMWSLISKVPLSSNKIVSSSVIIDVVVLGLRLLTKIPVIYAIEPDRMRRARYLRHSESNFQGQSHANPDPRDVYPPKSEASANCLSKILFTWINETITRGFYGELFSSKSLPLLPASLSAENLESTLMIESKLLATTSKFRAAIPLIKQLCHHFLREILLLGFVKFLFSLVELVNPVFLNYFIAGLVDFSNNWKSAVIYGIALIIFRVLSVFLDTSYDYWSPRFGYKIKTSVSCLVYQQLLRCKSSLLTKFGTGNLVNLLTTDVERVVNLIPSFNELWAMPVQVVVAVWLLYYQVGVSCLVGVGFLIILLPMNRVITDLIGKFSSELMHHKDVRVKFVSEMLQSMATVKLSCWEYLIRRKILTARKLELKALRGQKLLDAVCVFLWAACPAVLAGLTFGAYVGLGNTLEPAKVFTSLALFNMLTGPMNSFPWVLSGIVEAWISAGRICRLFEIDTADPQLTNLTFNEEDDHDDSSHHLEEDIELRLKSPMIFWESVDNPTLLDIDVAISKRQLVGVVGPIASGKSSFLLSLMGELQTIHPPSSPKHLRIAYVGYTPWLQKATIRENILFGEASDSDLLNTVIDACGLSVDLADMPEGLDTEVGEGGSRLSGGQRARVALARAVYQRADVYLFDDPLASLDSHVARSIIYKCIGRHGILADKIRVIATHQFKWLFDENDNDLGGPADLVIKLSEGRIVDQWTPANKTSRKGSKTDTESLEGTILRNVTSDASLEVQHDNTDDRTPLLAFSSEDNQDSNEASSTNWEKFAFGSISGRVYWTYARALGYGLAAWVLISLTLMQASRNAQDYWLSYWMQHDSGNVTTPSMEYIGAKSFPLIGALNQIAGRDFYMYRPTSNTTKFYLSIYGGIICATIFFTIFRSVLFAFAGLRAAAAIHENMLDAVLQGETHFFDTTPVGRLLNRFSSDVGTIDDNLPFIFNILLAIIFGLLGSLVVSCLAIPAIVILCVPLLFVYWSVQRVYRAAARDLRRISSITRTPLYAHFTETIGGLVVIRGLRKEDDFQKGVCSRLNAQTRCELAGLAASAWLDLRLQMIALLVVACVVLTGLVGRALNVVDVNFAGLAMIYALMLATLMTSLVSVMSSTEVDFVAVERCRELTEETPFEPDVVACSVVAPRPRSQVPDPHTLFMRRMVSICSEVEAVWPSQGRIVFKEVNLVYPSAIPSANANAMEAWRDLAKNEEKLALAGINLTVESGEHIGIVGRTGSGKSSLLRVLFRLVPHMEGPISNLRIARVKKFRGATGTIEVDSVDVRTVPLHILRSRMLCVSQDSFLFSGTVRENLDPDK